MTRIGTEPGVRARESTATVAIAAEQPDASPQPGDDAVRIVCHALALLALIALMAYCVIWAPRGRGGEGQSSGEKTGRVVAVGMGERGAR